MFGKIAKCSLVKFLCILTIGFAKFPRPCKKLYNIHLALQEFSCISGLQKTFGILPTLPFTFV